MSQKIFSYITTKIFLMTFHVDSHATTDLKPKLVSGVKTENKIPHDEQNVGGISHAHTLRMDKNFMQRHELLQSFIKEDLHIAKANTDIFRFAVFSVSESHYFKHTHN